MASWPTAFADQNYLSRPRTRLLVGGYSLGLLLLALPGLILGLCRRDALAWTLLLVFCSLAAAHAVGFFYDRYSYVKLPLLAMTFTITLSALEGRSIVLGHSRVRLRLAALVAVTALVGSASATVLLLAH